ncbi:MAG: alanyl-tRNA editing protein [Desulfurococcales archaeon]|nr:alanyl-tRNA editing protein [Desulfurococcales archaeon]
MPGTRLLYQEDSYLREFDATVVEVRGDEVALDATAFHPGPHGGLDTDTGYLVGRGGRWRVEAARLEGDTVYHRVPGHSLGPGERVHGVIDWPRRYAMMRLHTFSHILAAVLYERYGALVTGGHISPEGARDDFDLSKAGGEWRRALLEGFEEARRIAARCIEVKVYWLPREEALKIPGLVKLASRLPPEVERLRIVEIPGVDIQADGGPHVSNTCEIGEVELVGVESKGRRRRRIYYRLAGGGGAGGGEA